MAIPPVAVEAHGSANDTSVSVAIAQQAGSNRLLVFLFDMGGYTPGLSGAAAYGGVTPTALWAETTYADGNYTECIGFYIKEADLPANGSNTFTQSLTDAGWGCQVWQIDDVDQTDPINVIAGVVHDNTTNPSVDITTTVADCLLLAMFGGYDNRTISAPSGTIILEAHAIGDYFGMCCSMEQDAASATTHTVDLTLNNTTAADVFVVVAVAPATGGGGDLGTAEADGVGAATLGGMAVKRAVSAAPDGVGAVSADMVAIRAIAAAADGTSTTAVTLTKGAQKDVAAAADSVASTTVGLNSVRALDVVPAGFASITASLAVIRALDVASAGVGAATADLNRIAPVEAAADGVGSAAANLLRIAYLDAAADGVATASATLEKTGTLDLGDVSGVANTTAALAILPALRYLTALAAGSASVTATQTTVSAAAVTGKYAAEHAAAYRDVGDAQGFSEEHAAALRDIMDAGV